MKSLANPLSEKNGAKYRKLILKSKRMKNVTFNIYVCMYIWFDVKIVQLIFEIITVLI